MKPDTRRLIILFSQILLLAFICTPAVMAQEELPTPSPTPLTAPPPMKLIPRNERTQLEQTGDIKKRVRLTIELAVTHLGMAEKYTAQENFDAAAAEVGTYHALIENILTHLSSISGNSNKNRDVYKRLEMALRADGPRLTAMRRTTPLEYAVWIKVVEDYAREGRTEALNSFYGHTVVREPQKTSTDKPKPEPGPAPKSNQP